MILALTANATEDAMNVMFGTAAIGLFLLLTGGATLGLQFILMVVAPEATRRVSATAGERSLASFFVGLPILGVSLFAAGTLLHAAPGLGVLAVGGLGLTALFGAGAACEDIGRRIFTACGKNGNRAGHLAAGWASWWFASAVPGAGWFVVFPYVMASGVGAIVLAPFSRGQRRPPSMT